MAQKLLTKQIRKVIPALLSGSEKTASETQIIVKFFCPWSNWTWYATEGSPVLDEEGKEIDFEFFGLVEGLEKELGYFRLSELESVTHKSGLRIERDIHVDPKKYTLQDAEEGKV